MIVLRILIAIIIVIIYLILLIIIPKKYVYVLSKFFSKKLLWVCGLSNIIVTNKKLFDYYIKKILEEELLTPKDFFIKDFQELSVEGGFRNASTNYDDFAIDKNLVKFQLSLKPQFNLKFNFSLEKHIQSFFDKISDTIDNYKILKIDEKRRIKIEKIERERKEKIKQAKTKIITSLLCQ